MTAYLYWALPLLISETTEASEESVILSARTRQHRAWVDLGDNYSHDAFDVVSLASSVNTVRRKCCLALTRPDRVA